MKLEIGKRYVTRDGQVTTPLNLLIGGPYYYCYIGEDRRTDRVYAANAGGTHKCGIAELDLVSEYVENLESRMLDLLRSFVHTDGISSTIDKARALIAEAESKPAVSEPEIPAPEDGWLYYGKKPIAELSLHYTREHVSYFSKWKQEWVVGADGTHRDEHYAVKAGTQLAILCKLEPLTLVAGKRYVLTDGRVTEPLVAGKQYSYNTFSAAVDGDFTVMHCWNAMGHKWNDSFTAGCAISHPAD